MLQQQSYLISWLVMALSGAMVTPSLMAATPPLQVEYGAEDVVAFAPGVEAIAGILGDQRIGLWPIVPSKTSVAVQLPDSPSVVGELAISAPHLHSLSVLYLGGDRKQRLAMMDYATGQLAWNKLVAGPPVLHLLGYSAEDRWLLYTTLTREVCAIDSATGQRAWTTTFSGITPKSNTRFWLHTVASPEVDVLAVLSNDGVVARNRDGKELWHMGFSSGLKSLPQTRITDTMAVFDHSAKQVLRVNLATPKAEPWISENDITSVMAISPDAQRAVLRTPNEVVCTTGDNTKSVVLSSVGTEWSVMFTPDSKQIICLPGFVTEPREPDSKVVTCHRVSNIARIVDAATGTLVREVPLQVGNPKVH